MQGSFIKRHKIPVASGRPIGPADLVVGSNVAVYGKVIRIVDADAFTRSHLSSLGITLAPAEDYPADPFQAKQDAAAKASKKGPCLLSACLLETPTLSTTTATMPVEDCRVIGQPCSLVLDAKQPQIYSTSLWQYGI